MTDDYAKKIVDAAVAEKKKPKQVEILLELAADATLFHAPDETAYADVIVDGHRETWPVRSKGFRRWLTGRYHTITKGVPSTEPMQGVIGVLEAHAYHDGEERPVHVRVADYDDKIYIDLADTDWQSIEVGPDGWRIVADPPVRFRRAPGMRPLPVPKRGGKVDTLLGFLNVKPEFFPLVTGWLLAREERDLFIAAR